MDYSEPEPPVAADWLQRQAPTRHMPEVQVDVRERPGVRKPADGHEQELTPAGGATMVDLAIAEARLNPAPPRRRRVVGR